MPVNHDLARELLEMAVEESANLHALLRLCEILVAQGRRDAGDVRRAEELLEFATKAHGSPEPMVRLAKLLQRGYAGRNPDPKRAFALMQEAAETYGHPGALAEVIRIMLREGMASNIDHPRVSDESRDGNEEGREVGIGLRISAGRNTLQRCKLVTGLAQQRGRQGFNSSEKCSSSMSSTVVRQRVELRNSDR